jgi:2-isopropylmalate synthase
VLGFNLSIEDLDEVYHKFIELADKKKEIKDEELLVLVGVEQAEHDRRIQLKHLQVICGSSTHPVASVKIRVDGEEYTATADGNGPVDAAFNAVKQIIRKTVTLEEFLIQAITRGSDDLGKVHVQLENQGNLYYGFSANTDIVTASVEAFIDAISKIR